MSNPDVWADVKSRVLPAADAEGDVLVVLPNEQDPFDKGATFVRLEIHSSGGEPIGMGGEPWLEEGTIGIHVMVPSGSGFDRGNAIRHRLGLAFRRCLPIVGLEYRGTVSAPEDSYDEAGNWCRLSLSVSYQYQDMA
jgi:hypothetical protein